MYMNKKAQPKKDNTVLIVVISVIIFYVLPMIIVGVIVAGVLGLTIKVANVGLSHVHDLIQSVENPDGQYIYFKESTALEDMYNASLAAGKGTMAAESVTREQCETIEDFIDDELGDGIRLCSDDAFVGYAYSGGSTRVLELYGIKSDADKYVRITMNYGFDEYYNISIYSTRNGNSSAAKIIHFDDTNVPVDELDGEGSEKVIEGEVDSVQVNI